MIETYRRLLALLSPVERRRFYMLLVLIFVMGAMEAGGVLSVFPFLALLSDPTLIETDARVNAIYTGLGFSDPDSFIIAAGGAVFAFVVIGLAIKTLTIFAVTRFGYLCGYSMASRLISGYLARPYVWFLQRHSANLGKKVLSEVDNVISRALIPAIRFLAYSCIIVLMFVFITLADPVLALAAAGIFGSCYGLIFLLVRRYLTRIGQDAVTANSARFQIAQEGLGAIKDVKLLGLEAEYGMRFRVPARRLATVSSASVIIGDSPRYILEALAFGTMLAWVLGMLIAGDRGLAEIVPILGLFAFAGSRIFPTMQQLYRELTAMRFARAIIDTIYEDVVGQPTTQPPGDAARPRIGLRQDMVLSDIRYGYPGAVGMALNGVDMRVAANSTVGIVGGSGAGKTTLVDLMLGLLPLQQGAMRIDGQRIEPGNLRRWQNSIGYVPQSIFLTDDSVAANIALGVPADRIDHDAVIRAAKIAELHEFVMREMPDGYATAVGERGVRLSGGQRQRIGIARALYYDPDVLILDEATSALDNVTERVVMKAVHNLGHAKTIIMIAHRLSTVRDCDAIFVMEGGRVVAQGRYDALLAENPQFRAMVGSMEADPPASPASSDAAKGLDGVVAE